MWNASYGLAWCCMSTSTSTLCLYNIFSKTKVCIQEDISFINKRVHMNVYTLASLECIHGSYFIYSKNKI